MDRLRGGIEVSLKAAVEDARRFAEMVHARLNAGWDFSSPNFRFVALDNTRAERRRADKRTNFALVIQRELERGGVAEATGSTGPPGM